MRNRKAVISLILCVIMTFMPFCTLQSFADAYVTTKSNTNSVDVVENFTYDYIDGRSIVIDSVSSDSSDWQCTSRGVSFGGTDELDFYPYYPIDGDGCKKLYNSDAVSDEWYYVSRLFSDGEVGIDLSEYSALIIPFSAKGCADCFADISVTLYSSSGDKKAYLYSSLSTDIWNGIILNISAVKWRDDVSQIKIGVRYRGNSDADIEIECAFDCISASENADIVRQIYFSSDVYSISDAYSSLSYSYNPYSMDITLKSDISDSCYIVSGKITPELYENAEALAIRMKILQGDNFESLTLEYTTESKTSFSQNEKITCYFESTNDEQVMYFTLPKVKITAIRLSFNADAHGELEIYSIAPSSYASALPKASSHSVSDGGSISSCRISSESSNRIVIKGNVSEEVCSAYRLKALLIYELLPYESIERVFDSDINPVKSTTVSESFSVEIPLYEGERSRINSRFACVIYDSSTGSKILLGSPVYITNPEALAASSVSSPIATSKKGMLCNAQQAYECGISYSVVQIDLGRLFVSSDATAEKTEFSCEGISYYFDKSYVTELDEKINDLLVAGVNVNLQLVLTRPIYSSLTASLIPLSANSSIATRFGFNVDSASGVAYLSAAAGFIADRYFNSADGFTPNGIIVGSELDLAYKYYNIGDCTLRTLCDSYCRALRIITNVVRSSCSGVEIYVPIGNSWDKLSYDGTSLTFSSREIADCIVAQIKDEGNISVSFSIDPYAEGSEYNSEPGDGSLENTNLSFSSIPALCRYFKQSRMLYDGQIRPIMLYQDTEQSYTLTDSINAEDAINEYLLCYMYICSDVASAVECCVFNDSFIESSEEFYTFLSLLSSGDIEKYSASALEKYNITDWKEIDSTIRSVNTASSVISLNNISDFDKADYTGKAPLWSYDNNEGLYPVLMHSSSLDCNSHYISESTMSADSTDGCLSLVYVFPYKRDLSSCDVLSFDFSLKGGNNGVSYHLTADLMTDSGIISCHDYHISSKSSTVISLADVKDMCKSVYALRITVYDISSDSCTFEVGEMYAYSTTLRSDELANRFLYEYKNTGEESNAKQLILNVIIAVLAVSFCAEIIYILIRLSVIKHKRDEAIRKRREFFTEKFGSD